VDLLSTMSNKRPGTVDYSKFDNIDSDSDSESEDSYTPNVNNINQTQFDDNDSEDDYSSEDSPFVYTPASQPVLIAVTLLKRSFIGSSPSSPIAKSASSSSSIVIVRPLLARK